MIAFNVSQKNLDQINKKCEELKKDFFKKRKSMYRICGTPKKDKIIFYSTDEGEECQFNDIDHIISIM